MGHSAEPQVPETLDPKAEKKLCRKIDLMIVPTVSLLYLFCFIDRANIGASRSSQPLLTVSKPIQLTKRP